jgi:signal transduction histidine kinase
VELARLTREMGDSYALAVADGGRRLVCDLAEEAFVFGDRELLAQALINLLDNAQIHTPPGTRIEMSLRRAGARVRLAVADDGPGVPAPDRLRLTQRFARMDSSRSRPGHGLGLSLVAAICNIHGARLEISDNRPGLAVSLDFTLATA